jgi:hypothetical protein
MNILETWTIMNTYKDQFYSLKAFPYIYDRKIWDIKHVIVLIDC